MESKGIKEAAREYPAAVEQVATALRQRFESSELRGWRDEEAERGLEEQDPPLFVLEAECRRRWVTSPVRAVAALASSPNMLTVAGRWDWGRRDCRELRGTAVQAMALDVLTCARARGWTRRQRGKVAAKARRRA